jgi:peptide/nickel transport system ATP-binding protein
MDKQPLLSVNDLSVDFITEEGITHAVEGVGFDLMAGESMALVGESGSGKSVTALSVMRLLSRSAARITSGEVWFSHPERGYINLLKLNDSEMQGIRGRHLSMIFQEPMTSLNPVKRCGSQVMESLLWHGQADRQHAKHRVLELFEEVRLPDPAGAFRAWPHELSGGQKQRVMIAMAMACKPSLLIADEPTTALDVTVQQSILDLMRKLQDKYGMAILFISHDLGVVKQIASKAAVMRLGKIVEHAAVDKLFSNPSHPYTKALIACRPPTDSRPQRLAVVDDFLGNDASMGNFEKSGQLIPGDTVPVKKSRTALSEKEVSRTVPAKDAAPLLEVKNLRTYYVTKKSLWGRPLSYFKAVEDISFSVYRGETLGLVGESGCGKTTLGRSILRLISPNAGRVFFKGIDIASLSAAELRRLRPKIQIIFQDPYASLTPGLSVGSAIMEPMRVHHVLKGNKARKRKIIDLLERVGLEEKHYNRYPHEFSGGQRQRISIARALALEPEFIVCDESVSALDVSVQAQVLNLLNDLKREFGLTYIFISHDLSVVKYMSDRIIVMKNGRIEEIDEADALYSNPKSDYTRTLIDSIPAL